MSAKLTIGAKRPSPGPAEEPVSEAQSETNTPAALPDETVPYGQGGVYRSIGGGKRVKI